MRTLAQGLRRTGYYQNPDKYWNRRHSRYGTDLEGVGRIGLGHESNLAGYEQKFRRIREHLGAPARILDAGCGNGWLTVRLASENIEIIGVDFSEAAAEFARKLVNEKARIEVAPLHLMNIEGRFDVVTCIDVLFHVVDDEIWRSTIWNLLRHAKGGRLLIQEHLMDQGWKSPEGPAKAHTRWRTKTDYIVACYGANLVVHDRYDLEKEGTYKDILVFDVPTMWAPLDSHDT